MRKRILAILLALLTLIPLLIACQDSSEPVVGTDPVTTEAPETMDPTKDEVPDQDFKEREFLILLPNPEDLGANNYDVEEDSGDAIISAIYRRNSEIERRFNITITTKSEGDSGTLPSMFQPYALSNEDKVDMVAVPFYQSAKPMIVQDMILPWNGIPRIDLKRDYWNESVTETLALLGKYYLLVGDVNWTTMRETVACFFNQDVADSNESIVGDLYQTVRDDKWTYDKMLEIIKDMPRDNGDGTWDDKDTYGAVLNLTTGSYGLIYSCDFQTVRMTKDGPVPQYNTRKMTDILGIAKRLLAENHNTYSEIFDFTSDSKGIPLFFDNRALFYLGQLRHSESFRDKETDYGIIPYPKFDENQKEYVTYANQWGLSCALPCTATDLNRTGSILEAMSAVSRRYLVPAYYEKTLMGKIKRDEESEEMLNIIFSNVLYDFGMSYLCDFNLYPVSNLWSGNTAIQSWYRRNENKIVKNYWELYEHVYEQVNGVKPEMP